MVSPSAVVKPRALRTPTAFFTASFSKSSNLLLISSSSSGLDSEIEQVPSSSSSSQLSKPSSSCFDRETKQVSSSSSHASNCSPWYWPLTKIVELMAINKPKIIPKFCILDTLNQQWTNNFPKPNTGDAEKTQTYRGRGE